MIKLLKKCNYSVQNRSASQYQCGKHYLPTLSKECLSKIKKPCRLVHSDQYGPVPEYCQKSKLVDGGAMWTRKSGFCLYTRRGSMGAAQTSILVVLPGQRACMAKQCALAGDQTFKHSSEILVLRMHTNHSFESYNKSCWFIFPS